VIYFFVGNSVTFRLIVGRGKANGGVAEKAIKSDFLRK